MDTVIEYRKGILFIRLIGNLTKETCPLLEKEVNHIIKEYQIKNIVITVVVATSVVQGSLTLSFLCLIRIEQEQPSSNICSFYKRNIDERWILYSPQRLILPIQGNVH